MPSSTVPYDSLIPSAPVILEELKDAHFTKVYGEGIGIKFDPTSTVIITSDPVNGIKLMAPPIPELTCATVNGLYPSGTGVSAPTELLSKDCKSYKVGDLPINTSQLQPGELPSGVTISGSNITGPLSASATPETTNSLTISGNVLTSNVNGVIATETIPIPPPTTNVLTYDALNKTITSTVDGVASSISLSDLDDEGVSISISSGVLELRNGAGVVISSTPITDRDAQTLTLTGQTLAISGGNSVDLPVVDCSTIQNIFTASGTVTSSTRFLTADCTHVTSTNLIDAAYAEPAVAPTDTTFVYGPNGQKFKLKQNRSATGIPLGTWSLVP